MRTIIGYLHLYFRDTFRWRYALPLLLLCASYTISSYVFHLDRYSGDVLDTPTYFLHALGIYVLTFALPNGLFLLLNRNVAVKPDKRFWLLLAFALLVYCCRVALPVPELVRNKLAAYPNPYFWYKCIGSLMRTGILILGPALWWWFNDREHQPLYGFSMRNVQWRTYWTLLACMVPLMLLTLTQGDFLRYYPRVDKVLSTVTTPGSHTGHLLLYELIYGFDFVSVELFFRGFLILAFARYMGRGAILPTALFYVSIHYQKPLGECISSLFGGVLLGVITYETRSIWGGILVHVGIAWMMEAVGLLAKL